MKSDGYTQPEQSLSPFVERFWWSKISADTPLLPMNPATGCELLFYFSPPLNYTTQGQTNRSPQISLVRVAQEQLHLHALEDCSLLAIRFRTGMIRHFLPKGTIHELSPVIDAEKIWGSSVTELYEKQLLVSTYQEMVPAIELFLRELLAKYHLNDIRIDHLSNLFYYRSCDFSVQEVADKIGFSRRQLQRVSSNNFGITPKQYLSTVRINSVKKKMLFYPESHYLTHALDAGFFDQAHFIHEFKKMVNVTPAEFMCNYRNMSHFYNRSLPSLVSFPHHIQ